jgi:hypothetical protein
MIILLDDLPEIMLTVLLNQVHSIGPCGIETTLIRVSSSGVIDIPIFVAM